MRENRRTQNGTTFTGNIVNVRAVEDCIRATKKFTKGAFKSEVHHPTQGDEFPSKVLTEYYEVYPETELSWDMLATVAWAWVWGNETHIDVLFKYDYRMNRASVIIKNGHESVRKLAKGIPGFSEALAVAIANGSNNRDKV